MRISKEILDELAGLEAGKRVIDQYKTYDVVENKIVKVYIKAASYSQVVKVAEDASTSYFRRDYDMWTNYSAGSSDYYGGKVLHRYDEPDEDGTLEVTEVAPQEVMTTIYVAK